MKANIHPTWYQTARVTCACGNTFTIGSTLPEIHVEVCYNCHPFYTGVGKFIDTQGRVERFQTRQASATPVTDKKKAAKTKEEETPRKSLKEIMAEIKTQSK